MTCRYINKSVPLITRKYKIKCEMSPYPSMNDCYQNNKNKTKTEDKRARDHVAGREFLYSVGGKVN